MDGRFPWRAGLRVGAALALGVVAHVAPAAIPQAAMDDPRFRLGYLVVTHYAGVDTNGVGDSLPGLQAAVNDAYTNNLVALFPPGTYQISDTLHCRAFHPASGTNVSGGLVLAVNPCTSLSYVLQGSGLGPRPLLKLAAAPAADFDNTNAVRPLLLFRLYQSTNFPNAPMVAPPSTNVLAAPTGYKVDSSYLFNWELRNLDLDCGGHAGAVGVVFPAAQGSLVANVSINATNAFAGFHGLPGRNWGAVNVEVFGGRYGIRTGITASGSQCAGSTLLGVRLEGQTVAPLEYDDFVPLVMAGFRISKAAGPLLAVKNSNWANNTAWNTMTLLDGVLDLTDGVATNVAIANAGGKNLYLRNVWVRGATNLVQSSALAPLRGTGAWSRIDEYSHTDQRTTAAGTTSQLATQSMIDGVTNRTVERVKLATPDCGPPPAGLLTRHLPAHGLPCYEGAGSLPTVVVTDPPYGAVPGDAEDDLAAIQQAVDDASAAGHGRVFIPKSSADGSSSGAFLLSGTLVLRSNSVLFGASKNYVSELRTHSSWRPAAAADIVRTEDDALGAPHLGDLAIATDVSLYRHPFTFVHWRAGPASETFDLRMEVPYEFNPPANSNHYTGVRFGGGAGGRHYFYPEGELDKVANATTFYVSNNGNQYRLLRVEGTTQPLWLYGYNLEGGKRDRRDHDAEIRNAANIRWIGWKREGGCSMLRLENATNFALYAAGAMREALEEDRSRFEIAGASTGILFANVLVQADEGTNAPTATLRETIDGQPTNAVVYPAGVSLYKRGAIDDDAMRAGLAVRVPEFVAIGSDAGVFRLHAAGGVSGYRYGVETSADLAAWTAGPGLVACAGTNEVVGAPAGPGMRILYRTAAP
ncbi:MAG: hypothetical protein FJ221_14345 [Lentisphaerae bacterium]|nr:hypothetical protein [Lentisphaerota bacterium]